ncbi:MAG: N-Acetylneuraminate cytidylyltransferase [Oceanicaulis sp. HLUCCA04]|nr:MAG: N-Acetylneuraminate cytidylyltransferase [Oceanicaulis sp. HLUCCA04]
MECFVRFDADGHIGMGHAHRCLALADTLQSYGARVTLLTRNAATVAALAGTFPIAAISGDEVEAVTAHARTGQLLILDYAGTEDTDIGAIRTQLPGVHLALVGNREPAGVADTVIMQTPLAPDIPRGDALCGPEFILVKRSFQTQPVKEVRAKPARLFVCLGGGEPIGLDWIVDVLNRTAPDSLREIHVAGPGVSRAAPSAPQRNFVWQEGSTDLAGAMAAADIAIISGGGIIYEAAASGLAALYCPVVAHQHALAGRAQQAGFGLVCPAFSTRDAQAFAGQLSQLAADEAGRRDMAHKGQSLIDGKGAERVARQLLEQCRQRLT